jgi:HK97 family phage prohead protease
MKKSTTYSTKSGFEVKDMDSATRKVKVYLAKFDNIDSDGDIIRKGAFTKSIQEHGPQSTSNRKIAFLRHHDWQQPIGKFLELTEDNYGLLGVAELGRSSLAEDAWKDYEDGIIREHSIGFQYIKDKLKFIDDEKLDNGGYWEVKEVKLYEGSAVTFGANPLTNVLAVMKGEEKQTFLNDINTNFNNTLKTLLERKDSSEGVFDLEMKLKYLNSQLLQLALTESDSHSAKNDETLLSSGFDWNSVISKINV